MRIAIFSDVHAIDRALYAFIEQATKAEATYFWFLGDAVGYGPYPTWTVTRLIDLIEDNALNLALRGNHDQGLLDLLDGKEKPIYQTGKSIVDTSGFNDGPRQILEMHRQAFVAQRAEDIAPEQWLRERPLRAEPFPGLYLAHGMFSASDDKGTLWEYATKTPELIRKQLTTIAPYHITKYGSAPLHMVAVGHLHLPTLIEWDIHKQQIIKQHKLEELWAKDWIEPSAVEGQSLLINVGSISLPRVQPGLPSSSGYVLLDIEQIAHADGQVDHPGNYRLKQLSFRKVAYDWNPLVRGATAPIGMNYPMAVQLRQQLEMCPLPISKTADSAKNV